MPEPTPTRWHPLLALQELQPGHWALFDQFEKQYADIALVRRAGQLGYRTRVLAPRTIRATEVTFALTLRDAVQTAHRHWVGGHALDADVRPSHIMPAHA